MRRLSSRARHAWSLVLVGACSSLLAGLARAAIAPARVPQCQSLAEAWGRGTLVIEGTTIDTRAIHYGDVKVFRTVVRVERVLRGTASADTLHYYTFTPDGSLADAVRPSSPSRIFWLSGPSEVDQDFASRDVDRPSPSPLVAWLGSIPFEQRSSVARVPYLDGSQVRWQRHRYGSELTVTPQRSGCALPAIPESARPRTPFSTD